MYKKCVYLLVAFLIRLHETSLLGTEGNWPTLVGRGLKVKLSRLGEVGDFPADKGGSCGTAQLIKGVGWNCPADQGGRVELSS